MEEPEDILSVSLESLYEYTPITYSSAGSIFTYTVKSLPSSQSTITLHTPDTQPANWSLHASSIWVSAVYLSDHLADLHVEEHASHLLPGERLRILELGSGAGLPGICIAKTYKDVLVTVSDYPDKHLIRTLSENVQRNTSTHCHVIPYSWGSDIASFGNKKGGFDVIVAADTLWNPELHFVFLETLRMALRKTHGARVYLVAGLHTGRFTLQAFLDAVGNVGLEVEDAVEREVCGETQRPWSVARADNEDEKERRRWVLWIVLRGKVESTVRQV